VCFYENFVDSAIAKLLNELEVCVRNGVDELMCVFNSGVFFGYSRSGARSSLFYRACNLKKNS